MLVCGNGVQFSLSRRGGVQLIGKQRSGKERTMEGKA